MRSSRTARSAPPVESVAAIVQRLAVLLEAGVAPASAWSYLIDDDVSTTPDQAINRAVVLSAAEAAARGDNVAVALGRATTIAPESARRSRGVLHRRARTGVHSAAAWNGVAAAWFVATEAGAPLADCLHEFSRALRSLGATQRDLQTALAGPAASARTVMALPLVGVLFGTALGFNALATLFTTPLGLACLVTGGLLMLIGQRWNTAMVRRATPRDATPGLSLDLIAIGMGGGGSASRARQLLDRAATRFGISVGSGAAIESVLALSQRAGVPAVELLKAEAELRRSDARSEGQRVAASLGVRLMIPLAVCVLPAFMLLSVAPLMLAIISSTVGSLQ